MKRNLLIIVLSVLGSLFLNSCKAGEEYISYHTIKINEVFSELITRDEHDSVYSGQIKSEAGLADFEKAYGITLQDHTVDFDKQMLIFGITDNISTRAFQFLRQDNSRLFTLDYYDSGIKYKLRAPEEGEKYSYMQVYVLEKIGGISHISVKGPIDDGLSRVYD